MQAGEREPEPGGPGRWIRPFFSDSSLWPVTLVVAGCLVTLGTAVVLLALERNPFALGALAVMLVGSAEGLRVGRLGLTGRVILGFWALTAAASAGVAALDLFRGAG